MSRPRIVSNKKLNVTEKLNLAASSSVVSRYCSSVFFIVSFFIDSYSATTLSWIIKNMLILHAEILRAHFGLLIPRREKLPFSKVCKKQVFLILSLYFSKPSARA